MDTGYHFVGETLRDGTPIPPDGEWLEYEGELVMCESGLHYSRTPFDALQYAPGETLCRVTVEGGWYEGDKGVAERRRIDARIDATDLLRQFARLCAIDVIHLWDAPDVVRQYLETGDPSTRVAARVAARAAAWNAGAAAGAGAWNAGVAARAAAGDAGDAAWSAARAAAWNAAWATEGAATWNATKDAQVDRLQEMVNEAFSLAERSDI